MNDQWNFEAERKRMVEKQLAARNIRNESVLEAMRQVPRHRFVPPEHQHMAYSDGPLPIGSGQTISQPYIVALMTQLLQVGSEDKVLEIGTGSGYQAAVLGHLAQTVHTVEIHADLAERAQDILIELELDNVHIHVGDGSLGWSEEAPYDAILVTAAAPQVGQTLLNQLADGGRLVLPVGGRGGQYLERWTKQGLDDFKQERLVPVAFVPLRGESGWEDESWRF